MRISVLIPTYNRAEVLRKTLQGYSSQSGDHQMLEVLVVDDGSSDHTPAVVEECSRSSSVTLRYLFQKNAGLSAARNHAIREAKGELLLFGDDDIIPDANMVAEHSAWHRSHPEPNLGVLGYVTWAPELHPTPFMQWSGLYGPQFSFGCFAPGMELDFRYAYFCNTSLKASFLSQYGVFDESFRQYGWEDLELSFRLCKNGYKLFYNPAAFGYHYKFEKFEDTRRRVEQMYRSWPVFAKTDAGRRFLELSRSPASESSGGRPKAKLKRLLKPLKACAMPLCRPLMDTYIQLPHWLYDMVFYYYVASFSTFLDV